MQSVAIVTLYPSTNFAQFDALAKAVNCTQPASDERLACVKAVSAEAIHNWANGPQGVEFIPTTDKYVLFLIPVFIFRLTASDSITWFANTDERIQQRKTAQVPILMGTNQDDGTLFAVGQSSLEGLIQGLRLTVTVEKIRALYPGLSDLEIIPLAIRDFSLIW